MLDITIEQKMSARMYPVEWYAELGQRDEAWDDVEALLDSPRNVPSVYTCAQGLAAQLG